MTYHEGYRQLTGVTGQIHVTSLMNVFVEYRVAYFWSLQALILDGADTKPKQHELLQTVDMFLADRTYLAGNFETDSGKNFLRIL